MSRELKRVPLDFDWPVGQVWQGYLMPEELHENDCPDCDGGWSKQGKHLHNLWYGYVPFKPEDNGSTPLTIDTPEVRAFAERNVANSPSFYGWGEVNIVREARRLAALWNAMWCHHLNQDDVNALVEAGRLHDFTHTWSKESRWQPKDPPFVPTAEQVNSWSLRGMGHDGINAHIVIKARCEREGVPSICATCDGHGCVEAYPGQRAAAEAWEPTEPPTGEGWQAWSTVTEGNPCSPVFATPDELVDWACGPDGRLGVGGKPVSRSAAQAFIGAEWAPSMIQTAATGVLGGVEYLGVKAEQS